MQEFEVFIHTGSLFVIGAAIFIAQLLARELGGLLRSWVAGRTDEPPVDSTDKSYILSGVLGLLALLIAFTFSIAVDRFDERRKLVIAEANAIGTAEMRVQLLRSPDGAKLQQQLRDYARLRLKYGITNARGKPPLEAASARLRSEIQTTAVAALAPVAANQLGQIVVESINPVLDLGVERETMNAARVPGTVLEALISYVLLTAGVLGYALTGVRARHRPATVILFGLLTLAILLILDLDSPQMGSIRTDQTPMARLVDGFGPPTPPPVATP